MRRKFRRDALRKEVGNRNLRVHGHRSSVENMGSYTMKYAARKGRSNA